MKNITFLGSCVPFWNILVRYNSPHIDRFKRTHLGLDSFTYLFLSNIIKYDQTNIEWQTSIQGMSIFGIIWGKEKEALKFSSRWVIFMDNQFTSKHTFHRINPSTYLFKFDLLHLPIFLMCTIYGLLRNYHKLSEYQCASFLKWVVVLHSIPLLWPSRRP